WLSRVDSWISRATNCLSYLADCALDTLLVTETEVAGHFLAGTTPPPAPAPAFAPRTYPTMAPGQERQRAKELSWWTRFQTAKGMGHAVARTAVATAIVWGVLFMGSLTIHPPVVAYNGLARPVRVTVGGETRLLPAGGHAVFSPPSLNNLSLEA